MGLLICLDFWETMAVYIFKQLVASTHQQVSFVSKPRPYGAFHSRTLQLEAIDKVHRHVCCEQTNHQLLTIDIQS